MHTFPTVQFTFKSMTAAAVALLTILLCCCRSNASPINTSESQLDELVIHIVGHTHDDPGWLITADEYYVQEVQWIFYTVIPVLKQNAQRKFTCLICNNTESFAQSDAVKSVHFMYAKMLLLLLPE